MPDTVLELAAPARPPQISALRHAADAFLKQSIDDDLRLQMLLVISELCTNAVEVLHDPRAEVTLRVRDLDGYVMIEVEDRGPGFPEAPKRAGAGPDDERGRGLEVVRSLVDDLAVERFHGRTIVRCVAAKPAR